MKEAPIIKSIFCLISTASLKFLFGGAKLFIAFITSLFVIAEKEALHNDTKAKLIPLFEELKNCYIKHGLIR